MMSKVWLTRTLPAAEDSAQLWHEAISGDAVIIFTSKNGVDHSVCSGQRAICVGDATAEKAQAAGYSDVVSVDGTSEDITLWIAGNLPKTQEICHDSGWHVRGSIIEDLTELGFSARRRIVYRSVPSPNWPDNAFSSVAFYSPLAAHTFAEIAIDLVKDLSELSAICISPATAEELSGLALKAIHIAKRPREDELIMAAKLGRASRLAVKG